jgi:NAD(P)-dependent dehydrogenase (short-subunit alcohol dehydrogenase family)
MRFAGKTALITGGNSGIGLATARLFAAEGARVAILGRNEQTLAEAAESIGKDTVTARLDVADVASIEPAVARVAERLGRIDVVFANAGIADSTPVGDTALAMFEKVLRTNLTGAFFTVQAAVPYLRDGAAVVLNGSVHAVLGAPGYAAYGSSKAGIRALTRNLARSAARHSRQSSHARCDAHADLVAPRAGRGRTRAARAQDRARRAARPPRGGGRRRARGALPRVRRRAHRDRHGDRHRRRCDRRAVRGSGVHGTVIEA